LGDFRYLLTTETGQVINAQTDEQGNTQLVKSPGLIDTSVIVAEFPRHMENISSVTKHI